MSVLFHPSLGRFSEPEDFGGSATDSDSYYGRRRQAAHGTISRREEGMPGVPGTRRHRRFLNATMSESEYETEGEWDSDEDRPIVRFEWKQSFVAAGRDFFETRADQARVQRANALHRRRLPKLTRRKQGEVPAIPDDADEANLTPPESSHAHARRVRAAKFASHSGRNSAAASASESSATEATESELSADESSVVPAHTAPTGLQRVSIRESGHKRRVGQEHASTLFLQVEQSVRRSLRKVGSTEHLFLAELESLLVRYKQGLFKDHTHIYSHFDLLPYDVAAERDQHDDTDVTSDDDEVLVDHAPRKQRRYPLGEEPLSLSFRNSFERYLAHGLVQFHQLVATSHTTATGARITDVRIPKAGVLLHHAQLVPYLQRMQAQRN